MTDAEAKVCYTCNHYPNNEHCIGCVWDKEKGNTKWELKKSPIVLGRTESEKIREYIETHMGGE